jgi:DNA-binding response OmpR family regulator
MPLAPKIILVVEDDLDSRQALCLILETLGHKAIAFETAKEALEAIPKHKLDVAMLDVMLPGMNGYELMTEIKKIPALAEMPVIMVTARDEDSEIWRGYQSGADYYITKPYTARQIDYGLRLFFEKQEE